MKRLGIKGLAAAVGTLAILAIQNDARAIPVNPDYKLAQGDVDMSYLSGTVDMSWSGSVLTIILQNTSADAAGSGAGVLLTGIGFSLPDGLTIVSGSANMGTSTAVGFTKPLDGNVSQEWGFDTGGLNSGVMIGHPVNNAVSSMESQTTDQFQPGSLVPPPQLDGPDMGLVSLLETDPLGSGVEAIKDTLTITLNLSGTYGDLVQYIDDGTVILTFGSPSNGTTVPDGGSTLALLGASLMGLGWFARRRSTVSRA